MDDSVRGARLWIYKGRQHKLMILMLKSNLSNLSNTKGNWKIGKVESPLERKRPLESGGHAGHVGHVLCLQGLRWVHLWGRCPAWE
jgi:hypothetical protein